MKNRSYFLYLLLIPFIFSCNASKNTSSSEGISQRKIEVSENQLDNTNWANLLRQVPGLNVSGIEPDLSLTLRGAKSLQGENQPLIVLDGVILGRNFGDLARAVLPRDVASVSVLNTGQASRYGTRGAYGVIEVKLKE